MKRLVLTIFGLAFLAGCATQKKMSDDGRTRAERAAACDYKCAPSPSGCWSSSSMKKLSRR